MVSAMWAMISFQAGLLVLVVLPLLGQAGGVGLRQSLTRPYFKWAETCLGASAIVWRQLGRPTLKPISIDDEREVAEVVQSSGTLSDDQKLPFRDPADAKHTWFSKQLMVVPEGVPAAVDAEMAELGHWFDRKARDGLETDDGKVDPYVPLHERARSIHPMDVLYALDTSVSPEDIKTTERHTEARFQKYGGSPTLKEGGAMLVSFGVGAGIVAGLVYLRDEVMDGTGGSGGGGTVSFPPGMLDMTGDVVTVMAGGVL